MARIELSNIGGGGGTTLSLTTTGTSGAATLAGSVLNIPVYQGALTLTTTGTSGAATLSGTTLNIPNYATGGSPAGSAGQVQFNSTPAGSFAASANLAWDNTATQLNIGAPSAPTGKLNVKGSGSSSSTVNLRLTNSGNTEIFRVNDDGSLLATNLSYDPTSRRLGVGAATTNAGITLESVSGSSPSIYFQNTSAVIPSYSTAGFVPAVTTNTVGAVNGASVLGGGIQFYGFTTSSATFPSLTFTGYGGSTAPTWPSIRFRGAKHNGSTSAAALTGDEIIVGFAAFTNADVLQVRANGNVNLGDSFTPSARLNVRGSNTSSGTNALLVQNSTPSDLYKIENNGKISYLATNTAAGTTGAQTIDRPSGTVNFAAGATSLVVTNSLCTTSSIVLPVVRTNDTTATIKNVVPAAGSFTINLGAAATAETSVGFFIIN